LDVRALGGALLWTALAAVGFYLARVPHVLVRWSGGLLIACVVIDAGYALTGVVYRVLGFVAPPLHVWPVAALSVGELWGGRWARPVSTWLRETCFRPFARRGRPMLGLFSGFVVSALGHAYPVLVAVGL